MINEAQLILGSKYAISALQKKKPIDQINVKHALLEWLVKNKQPSSFTNGVFGEPLFVSNDGNAQNYSGADQVTYNERDPANWTSWGYYSLHDGFWFDEDRLIKAGLEISEDSSAVATTAEKEQLLNLVTTSYDSLRKSMQEHMAFEMYRDGSQSAKACPGFGTLIKTDPTTGTVGGIDAATYTYWRNNADIGVAAASLIDEMDQTHRNCMRYGGVVPNAYFAGEAFIKTYQAQAGLAINRQINGGGNSKGGVTLDPGVTGLFYKGVPIIWDPTLEALDALLGTTTATKSCYFVHSDKAVLRPVKNQWMVDRKPERLPDRYVYYFGRTAKYSLTTDQRNALAVVTIA